MYNIKNLPLKTIFLIVQIILFTTSYNFAQSTYKEIEVYRSLLNREVLPRLKQEKDYGHIARMYFCKGGRYLGKDDYRSLSMVIDSISHYAHKDYYNHNKHLKQGYKPNGKYSSGVGDAKTVQHYNDSLISIYKAEESEYTSQFISDARRDVSDQKIRLCEERITRQQMFILFILIILGVIIMGMIIIIQLYRKHNAAYKALAQKATEWANDSFMKNAKPLRDMELSANIEAIEDTENKDAIKEQANEKDKQIMSLLKQKMFVEHIYREKNLTMDELADQLGVSRHLLSRAVNSVAGINFYQYINGYRIKEAVRIISHKGHNELYINDVYESVGFTNRTTFYRVFKQFTGLSPLAFQKKHENDKK